MGGAESCHCQDVTSGGDHGVGVDPVGGVGESAAGIGVIDGTMGGVMGVPGAVGVLAASFAAAGALAISPAHVMRTTVDHKKTLAPFIL